MASERQFAANRRNAARSTGPRTELGKLRSRQNACRHGLTAETVIPSLEDVADYQALENGLTAEHCPGTRLEQELVARLASLLWRLRRAALIETGLLEMQGAALLQHRKDETALDSHDGPSIFYKILLGAPIPLSDGPESPAASENQKRLFEQRRKMDIAAAYLRVYRNSPGAVKRLGRYETALWKQVAQTLVMLDHARTTSGIYRMIHCTSKKRKAAVPVAAAGIEKCN